MIDLFIKHLERTKHSTNTITAYTTDLTQWREKLSIPMTRESLPTREQINDAIDNFDCAESSMVRKINCLKSYFNWMVDNRHITAEQNPTTGIRPPKVPKKIRKSLNQDESTALYKLMLDNPNARDRAVMITFLTCGLRKSELIGLNRQDYNGRTLLLHGKGNKEREIPVPNVTARVIDDYLKTRDDNSNIMFITSGGNRIAPQNMNILVDKYLKQIGRDDLSPHKLRHTAATNMIASGADISEVKDILGHENIQTTQIYIKSNQQMMRKTMNRIDSMYE